MRRFLRRVWAVDVLVTFGLAVATVVVVQKSEHSACSSYPRCSNTSFPQSNLMNAFTGAKMYYSDADDSFTGILTGGGVNGQATSTLSQIGTGLSFVSGTAAPGGHTISIQTGAHGTWLELAAWAPGVRACWLLLDNTSKRNTGNTNGFALPTSGGTAGVHYGVTRNLANSSTCKPGLRPTATSTRGYPSP